MGLDWEKRKEELNSFLLCPPAGLVDSIIRQEKIIAKQYYDMGKENNIQEKEKHETKGD